MRRLQNFVGGVSCDAEDGPVAPLTPARRGVRRGAGVGTGRRRPRRPVAAEAFVSWRRTTPRTGPALPLADPDPNPDPGPGKGNPPSLPGTDRGPPLSTNRSFTGRPPSRAWPPPNTWPATPPTCGRTLGVSGGHPVELPDDDGGLEVGAGSRRRPRRSPLRRDPCHDGAYPSRRAPLTRVCDTVPAPHNRALPPRHPRAVCRWPVRPAQGAPPPPSHPADLRVSQPPSPSPPPRSPPRRALPRPPPQPGPPHHRPHPAGPAPPEAPAAPPQRAAQRDGTHHPPPGGAHPSTKHPTSTDPRHLPPPPPPPSGHRPPRSHPSASPRPVALVPHDEDPPEKAGPPPLQDSPPPEA